MDRIRSSYRNIFTTETQEHLDGLSSLLMRLEQAPQADWKGILDELFRHAHSVKGAAGMMGFDGTAAMAHQLEDWLSAFRNLPFRRQTALIHSSFLDGLLSGVSHLTACVREDLASRPVPQAPGSFAALEAVLKREAAQAAAGEGASAAAAASSSAARMDGASAPGTHQDGSEPVLSAQHPLNPSKPLITIRLTIDASSRMPAIRAFLSCKKISDLGDFIQAIPSIDDLKAGRFPADRTILIKTQAPESAVRNAINSLSEISETHISSAMPEGLADASGVGGASADAAKAQQAAETSAPSDASAAAAAPSAKKTPGDTSETETPTRSGPTSKNLLGSSAVGLAEDPEGTAKNAPTLRVKTELLDTLLDTVGDIIFSLSSLREDAKKRLLPAETERIGAGVQDPLLERIDALHRETRALHGQVIAARMTAMSSVTDRLRRAVRELLRVSGKDVDFQIHGDKTEVDHAVLDVLADPLIHLVRNAVDHGLETPGEREASGKPRRGSLTFSAHREQSRIIVEISDDGRGLDAKRLKECALERGLITRKQAAAMTDAEAWRLCFLPGLSTSAQITSVSGRGVGMDIVKSSVESVGGGISITSAPGKGTTWRLSLPYTVAIAHILSVRVGADIFGLPIANVVHVAMASPNEFVTSSSERKMCYHWKDQEIPVYLLSDLLGLKDDQQIRAEKEADAWRRSLLPFNSIGSIGVPVGTPSPLPFDPGGQKRGIAGNAPGTNISSAPRPAGVRRSMPPAPAINDLDLPADILLEGWIDDLGQTALFQDGIQNVNLINNTDAAATLADHNLNSQAAPGRTSRMVPFVPNARDVFFDEKPLILYQTDNGKIVALVADDLCGQQRSILRPLRPPLDMIPCLVGVTLQTNGMPSFIVDVGRII